MSHHTAIYRRNHSYDAQSPERSYDTHGARVSSVPRVNVVPYSYGSSASYVSPNFIYDSSPHLYSSPDHRRSILQSPRVSLDMDKTRHNKHHRDLKRKTVFVLHKEVQKPVHSFILEEISDIGRITEICMDTLKSMMASRTQRQYVHHMNNNAVTTVDDLGPTLNSTNNQTSLKEEARKAEKSFLEIKKRLRRESKELEQQALQEQRMLSQRAPRTRADTPYDLTSLYYDTKAQRIQRHNDMVSMNKLRSKLPTDSLNIRPDRPSMVVSDATALLFKEQEEMMAKRRSTHENIESFLRTTRSYSVFQQRPEMEIPPSPGPATIESAYSIKRKTRSLTPVEALECKYLRLNEDQVHYLEDLVRASGKSPGIHAHANVDILTVFEDLHTLKIDTMKKVALPTIEDEADELLSSLSGQIGKKESLGSSRSGVTWKKSSRATFAE